MSATGGAKVVLDASAVLAEALVDADTVRAAQLIAASKSDPETGSPSLGDGLCIATAERLGLPLTGGDRYWAEVGMTGEVQHRCQGTACLRLPGQADAGTAVSVALVDARCRGW